MRAWLKRQVTFFPLDFVQPLIAAATMAQDGNGNTDIIACRAHWAQPGIIRHTLQWWLQALKVITIVAPAGPLAQEHLVPLVGIEATANLASSFFCLHHRARDNAARPIDLELYLSDTVRYCR